MNSIHAALSDGLEGIPPFLHISSTGQLIVTPDLLHLKSSKRFEVILQSGMALAVLVFCCLDIIHQARQITILRDTKRFWPGIVVFARRNSDLAFPEHD